jgi:hypothetical protein
MLSVSSLIEFLMNLLRDEEAQAEFARDPQGVLSRHGLEGVTAQDVCEARPVLADTFGVRPSAPDVHVHRPVHHHHHDDDDAVREITHVVNNHSVDKHVIVKHDSPQYNTYNEYNSHFSYTDNSITADTVIQDSFNQDNDGIDNKGGVIEDSNVANGDQEDVGNTDETTTVEDSFNEEETDVDVIVDSGNDSSDNSTTVTDSGNDSSTSATLDVNDSYNTDSSTTVDDVDVDATAAATV